MKKSKPIQEMEMLCMNLGMDSDSIWHKTKALLKIYRKVVWVLQQRVQFMVEESSVTYGKSLEKAVAFLNEFAPIEQQYEFEHKVTCLFETKWLINLIDRALMKIQTYPEYGKVYFTIIQKVFLSEEKTTDLYCMEILHMEKTMYYQRKKEAIYLMGISLFGYAIPQLEKEFYTLKNIA